MKRLLLITGFVLLVSYPVNARAGVMDSPVPQLGGAKTSSLFVVTGVTSAGGLGTFFSCTNTSSTTGTVSVELFVDAGGGACNDASSVAVTVAPGATVLFSTQNNADSSFFSSQPLSAVDMFLSSASARIIATTKLACNAFVSDVYNSPPSSMMRLPMFGKGKVKGD